MLDVPSRELTASPQNDLRTHEARLGMNQAITSCNWCGNRTAPPDVVAAGGPKRHAIVLVRQQPLVSTFECTSGVCTCTVVSVCCQCRSLLPARSRRSQAPG